MRHERCSFVLRGWLLFWLVAGTVLWGCLPTGSPDEESLPDQTDSDTISGTVELAQTVSVMEVNTVSRLIDATDTSLTFSSGAGLEQVAEGTVLASASESAPFLRKVTQRSDSEDGKVTLVTEDVLIDELFSEVDVSSYGSFGSFEAAAGVELNNQSSRSRYVGGLGPDAGREIPITDFDLTLKVDKGVEGSVNVKLSTSALLELDITGWFPPTVNRIKTTISSNYEFGIGLASPALEYLNRSIPLGRVSAIFWIGVVPVYSEIDFAFVVIGDLKGAAAVSFKGSIEAGGEYLRTSGWREINDHQSLVAESKLQAQMGLQALVSTHLKFYRVGGPLIRFGPTLTAALDLQDTCKLDYDLAMKVEGAIDFTNVFKDSALDYNPLGIEFKSEITKGTYRLCEVDKPNAPTVLQASADKARPPKCYLSWKDNADNESGYLILWSDGGEWGQLAFTPANTTGYVHDSPSAGLDNLYQVYAVGTQGTRSDASNMAVVSLPGDTAPAAPTSLAAAADEGRKVVLTWVDNADNEVGFQVERASSGGSYATIALLDADTVSFVDNTVDPEETYTYRVLAYNAEGDSDYSNEVTVNTPLFEVTGTIPAAPGDLTATLNSDNSVTLNWTDYSTIEMGFSLERGISAGTYEEISSLAANVTSYQDTGLTEGTTYFYQVRAFNADGYSEYSDTVSVTTNGGSQPDDGGGTNTDDWVVYADAEQACWDIPLIVVRRRDKYESATAATILQGGFTSDQEGLDWICPQFTARKVHAWCGSEFKFNGTWYRIAYYACPDLYDLPVEE